MYGYTVGGAIANYIFCNSCVGYVVENSCPVDAGLGRGGIPTRVIGGLVCCCFLFLGRGCQCILVWLPASAGGDWEQRTWGAREGTRPGLYIALVDWP